MGSQIQLLICKKILIKYDWEGSSQEILIERTLVLLINKAASMTEKTKLTKKYDTG